MVESSMTLNTLKRTRLYLILFIACSPLSSCWFPCSLSFEGKAINKITRQPVDSVLLTSYQEGNYDTQLYTDTTGSFLVVSGKPHSAFMWGKCKMTTIEFSKKGYKTVSLSSHSGDNGLIIEMEEE